MPRFKDDWVVNKSLFEYTTGGSCACCSFPFFDPNGLKGLISSVSDLETDAAEKEYQSAQQSPWPADMRDSIWADRVKVRYKMKKEMKEYKSFLDEVEGGEEGLIQWCINEVGAQSLRRIFQMSRSEVTGILSNKYGICAAYGTVMCAVVEQVANFNVTKYDTDARSESEAAFEKAMVFNRRGGFMLNVAKQSEHKPGELEVDETVLKMFVDVIKSLGGPKLLHRGPSKTKTKNENKEEEDTNEEKDDPPGGVEEEDNVAQPSFRSDRRIARLVIARYWADQLISTYNSCTKILENLQLEDKDQSTNERLS